MHSQKLTHIIKAIHNSVALSVLMPFNAIEDQRFSLSYNTLTSLRIEAIFGITGGLELGR